MKKMNNKGFAISTMLYGLLIIIVLVIAMILNIMAFNRKNSKEFIEGIVDELEKEKPTNFSRVLKYSENVSDSYCVTGDEGTCIPNTCYKDGTICDPGTIVEYKVNDVDPPVRFHVISDDGSKLTMQSQVNTVSATAWNSPSGGNSSGITSGISSGISSGSCTYEKCVTTGPITMLNSLNNATTGWSNVNNLASSNSFFTDCSSLNYCPLPNGPIENLPFTLSKARVISLAELSSIGCNDNYCPKWVYANGNSQWTMTFFPSMKYANAWYVSGDGIAAYDDVTTLYAARVVVEVNKV